MPREAEAIASMEGGVKSPELRSWILDRLAHTAPYAPKKLARACVFSGGFASLWPLLYKTMHPAVSNVPKGAYKTLPFCFGAPTPHSHHCLAQLRCCGLDLAVYKG